MAVTYRTAGAWGAGKGSALTASEVDGNFWELFRRAVDLLDNPAEPVYIDSITLDSLTLTIQMTDTTSHSFDVPVGIFRWRGEWQPSETYEVMDLIHVVDDGLYMATTSHESDTELDTDNFMKVI